MENFRTIVTVPKSEKKISYSSKVMFIGSCFTENIGNRMAELKFPVDINPFGIVYNPASIINCVELLMANKPFAKDNLHYENERWFSFYHHSRFSDPDAGRCLQLISERLSFSAEFLRETGFLVITLGTAWIYRLKKTGEIVSNCHKLAANNFERSLLNVGEIISGFKNSMEALKKNNPELKIIFTVSPVRHWNEGAEGNLLSKSALVLAVHELKKMFDSISYFPAYEIMMDDLRDYRFYAGDMLHPSQVAINYIYDIFSNTYFDADAMEIIPEIEKLNRAIAHKPFNRAAKSYKQFLKTSLDKIEQLEKKYSYLRLEDMRDVLNGLLAYTDSESTHERNENL